MNQQQRPLPMEPIPRLFGCSPSKLSTWMSCPRRFRFAYLDRPPPPKAGAWAHFSYGTSTHIALRAWWDLPLSERTPAAAGALLRDVWVTDGFRDDDQSDRWCAIASRQVVDYAHSLNPEREPLGLERQVAMKTAHLAFTGRVDRIDEVAASPSEPRQLVIVDYKTGKAPPDDFTVRASSALALYAEAAQRLFRRRCRRVELHHLPSGTVAAWEHDDGSVNRHLERADQVGVEAGLASQKFVEGKGDPINDFPARPSAQCSWCDFRSSCPEGEQASIRRNSWDGLPTD